MYEILPRNQPFLTKISDFVKLFESSLEIHFGVLGTFWGLRNRYYRSDQVTCPPRNDLGPFSDTTFFPIMYSLKIMHSSSSK